MDAIDLHVTVGAEDQESRLPECARKVQQQIERIPVRVMEVLQHQRLVDRSTLQEAGNRLQQAPLMVRWITRRARRDIEALG